MTLKGTWDFQTKLVGKAGEELERWEKARKKDLTVDNPEEDKDQDLVSKTDGVKCKHAIFKLWSIILGLDFCKNAF